MPSNARRLFREKLLPDVAALVDAHRELNPDGHGRRKLGHITRGGVLMLCAAWELFVEELVCEGVKRICEHTASPHNLPNHIKGKICQVAKNDKNNFGVLGLSGGGWKEVYLTAAKTDCENLNTPKFGQISNLFKDWLDLEPKELEASWRHGKETINEFVRLRGEIAHRGADSQYVRISDLVKIKTKIDETTVDTDRLVAEKLKALVGRKPWNN